MPIPIGFFIRYLRNPQVRLILILAFGLILNYVLYDVCTPVQAKRRHCPLASGDVGRLCAPAQGSSPVRRLDNVGLRAVLPDIYPHRENDKRLRRVALGGEHVLHAPVSAPLLLRLGLLRWRQGPGEADARAAEERDRHLALDAGVLQRGAVSDSVLRGALGQLRGLP
jgi:hypothetical protein